MIEVHGDGRKLLIALGRLAAVNCLMSVECVAPRSSGWDICDGARTAGDDCIATPDTPKLSLAKRMASVAMAYQVP